MDSNNMISKLFLLFSMSLYLVSNSYAGTSSGIYPADGFLIVSAGRHRHTNAILEYCTDDKPLINGGCKNWVAPTEYIKIKTGRNDLEYLGIEGSILDFGAVSIYYRVKSN